MSWVSGGFVKGSRRNNNKAVTGENPTLHPGDMQRPIDNVTWFDAVLYCNALSGHERSAYHW